MKNTVEWKLRPRWQQIKRARLRRIVLRRLRTALSLAMLVPLLASCLTMSSAPAPVQAPAIPPLPPEARQPKPSEELRKSAHENTQRWQTTLSQPLAPEKPASGTTNP